MQFIIIAYDGKDKDALARRMAVRQEARIIGRAETWQLGTVPVELSCVENVCELRCSFPEYA